MGGGGYIFTRIQSFVLFYFYFGPDDEEEPAVSEDDENILDVVPIDQAQKNAELATTANDFPKQTTDDILDCKEDTEVLEELATVLPSLPSLPSDVTSRKRNVECKLTVFYIFFVHNCVGKLLR